ncbi:MAG: tRNA (N6-isopentenyl adenosine(37)-C2)-methylthiotransferase MiaB [Pseudomonadota bacterium]
MSSQTDTADMRKRVHVRTYGCQMNVYDSERMTEALDAAGYDACDNPADADLVVLNTCHIREKAAEKVYSELGRVRQMQADRRADGKDMQVVVAGCVAQAEGAEITRRAPVVDLVVGPQSYHRLPELVGEAGASGRAIVATDFEDDEKFAALPARPVPGPSVPGKAGKPTIRRAPSAFLTVQEGCDKFCTFCVVPYTRGAEFSRPVTEIVTEAKRLVSAGVRELTLLGQNVNAYHGLDETGTSATLAELLDRLSAIEGLARLRYTTSHPRDMDDALITAHRDNAKVMPYLHLPFQAGSDGILAAMNRKHTAQEYLDLVGRIRTARPDLALSTDIIVGFPGESDADFDATLAIVEDVVFAQAYSFKYSPRPGTPAASIDDQVPEEVKSDRLQRLQRTLFAQQTAFNASKVGATMPVLFERAGKHPGQLVGRSPWLQAVHADGPPSLIGEVVEVSIDGATTNSLSGRINAMPRAA